MEVDSHYLLINLGSSSKRYALAVNGTIVYTWYVEKAQSPQRFKHSIGVFLKELKNKITVDSLDAISFRVVAPGTFFTKHRHIDTRYLKALKKAAAIAPLHIEPLLAEIKAWKATLKKVPFYAISDSAFHATMPNHSKIYALPPLLAKRLDIYRFGYHGISVASIVHKLQQTMPTIPKNIVVCHLGGGSSVTAVQNGVSVDTSMGFTPLEGLPMATRSGSMDPAIINYLILYGFKPKQIDEMLFKKSGILAISSCGDTRSLFAAAQNGDKVCLRVIDFYAYHIKKYIGSYYAALGGIDVLVFTGGIGEGSPLIRALACEGLEKMGIELDKNINTKIVDVDAFVQSTRSKTKILAMQTEEMQEMARQIHLLL